MSDGWAGASKQIASLFPKWLVVFVVLFLVSIILVFSYVTYQHIKNEKPVSLFYGAFTYGKETESSLREVSIKTLKEIKLYDFSLDAHGTECERVTEVPRLCKLDLNIGGEQEMDWCFLTIVNENEEYLSEFKPPQYDGAPSTTNGWTACMLERDNKTKKWSLRAQAAHCSATCVKLP